MSHVKKEKEKSGEASLSRVCYQRGLPRLVLQYAQLYFNSVRRRITLSLMYYQKKDTALYGLFAIQKNLNKYS